MKLNNRGFAISTIMYMILIMAIVLITLTLSVLSSRKLILDKISLETTNTIYNVYDITYRQALTTLKEEAIEYAAENNLTNGNILIGDLNSSLSEEILNAYNLMNKYLAFRSNNDSYNVFLGNIKTINNVNDINKGFIDVLDYKIYGNSKQQLLPDEYQQVEYIESTGTQYIDTGVIPDNETGISLTVAFLNLSSDLFRFGTRQDSGETRFIIGTNKTTPYFGFGKSKSVSTVTITANKFYTFKMNYLNSKKSYIDNTEGPDLSDISSINFTYSLVLFGRNSSGSITSSAQKVKQLTITKGNSIIRNMIPCYRKSDNVIGMYDLVNNQFYTNDGTGTFTKGSNTPTPTNPIKIESVGDLVTDTSDENYGKYKIPVTINQATYNIYLDEPLRKVGDYSDFIDFKNQKIIRQVDKKLLKVKDVPTIKLSGYSIGRDTTYFNLSGNLAFEPLCEYLKGANSQDYNVANTITHYRLPSGQRQQMMVALPESLLGTNSGSTNSEIVSAINNWADENKVMVYYPLATPIEESIYLPSIDTGNYTSISIDTNTNPVNVEFTLFEKIRQL